LSSSDAIETYRALHATIKYASGEPRPHSVLLVDIDRSTPTTVAENLARAFARAGDRCALVDANLRAASEEVSGLSDLLDAEAREALVVNPDQDGLARIGPGTKPHPELLVRDELEGVLGELGEAYGYVIVTCAPLPEFGDAVAIAPRVDAVILVITAGVTGREAAIRARDALERVGARVLGLVMVERPRRWF
jgi:Mrp family chromosome partitioning ATPase